MKSTPRYSRSLQAPILLLCLLLPFATALAQKQENLVGTWQWTEGDVSLTLKLNDDGTATTRRPTTRCSSSTATPSSRTTNVRRDLESALAK